MERDQYHASLSKIVEKAMMKQMMEHLDVNKLFDYNHHGSVPCHSTQMLILELHDKLIQSLEEYEDGTALILIDQSKAYDLIPHQILIEKMQALNYLKKTLNTLTNYLAERKQYIQIQNIESDVLSVGPKSVTQGSTLSCCLFLIYILDAPRMGHGATHSPLEYRNCPKTNLSTFVDDNYVSQERKKIKSTFWHSQRKAGHHNVHEPDRAL